jgi:hypothetical protein
VVVGRLGDAVQVLEELPREPALTDPGDAGHGDQVRAALALRVVEEVLDQAKLPLAADERRLESLRLERPACPGDDPERAPERDEARLPLQLVRPGALVDDRRLCRAPRRVADEYLAWLRDRLHA